MGQNKYDAHSITLVALYMDQLYIYIYTTYSIFSVYILWQKSEVDDRCLKKLLKLNQVLSLIFKDSQTTLKHLNGDPGISQTAVAAVYFWCLQIVMKLKHSLAKCFQILEI